MTQTMGKHPLYNQTGLQKDNKSHVLYALANKQMELKQLEVEYQTKISKIKNINNSNFNDPLRKINPNEINPETNANVDQTVYGRGQGGLPRGGGGQGLGQGRGTGRGNGGRGRGRKQ